MRELGINFKLLNGYNYYKITIEQLQKIADSKKWLHELDNDELNDDNDDDSNDEDYDNGIDKNELSIKATTQEKLEHYKK